MPLIAAIVLAVASAAPKPTALPTLAPALVKVVMPSFTVKDTAINVKVNEPFQVRLEVASGTGYTWQPQPPLDPGISVVGMFSRPSSKMMPGGPSEEVIVFRAADVGTERLVLQCIRPWDHPVKPARTAAFTISVHK